MFRKVLISVGLAIVILASAQSQNEPEVKKLTLSEVIDLAHEQSLMALLSRHTFRRSYWEYRSYQASTRPGLTLTGTLPSLTMATESVIQPDGTEEFVDRSFMRTSLTAQLNQNIWLTGGRVFITSELQRNDNFGEDPPYNYLSNPVTIGFAQPINGYNQFKWDRKIEPLKYDAAKLTYINAMERVSQRAVGYFFDLALAQINLQIAEKNLANSDTLYQIAQGRYELGTIAENDLLQLELSRLNSETSFNEATIDLELRRSRLRSFLGFNERVGLELILPTDIPQINIEYEKTLAEARANNPEILGYQQQLLEAEQAVAEARSQKGIRGDLFAQFGLNGVDNSIQDAYTGLARQQRVEVGITVPILDWGQGKGRYRMAQSAEEVAKTDINQSLVDFDENIFLQVMQFNLQDDQVVIASKADTIADLRYEVTKQRFLIGKIDVLDLNVALEEKDVARRSYVEALRNYWNYYYDLRGLTLYDWQKDVKLTEDFDALLEQ